MDYMYGGATVGVPEFCEVSVIFVHSVRPIYFMDTPSGSLILRVDSKGVRME